MDVENKNITLDEMRAERENASVAFINFTSSYEYFNSHVFCFYEGEDGKYYNQKIKAVIGDKIITVKAGDKLEVLKIWRKIKSISDYDCVSKCFFVDKDMDDPPEDINDDLFITPCYSIENLYTTVDVLGNILQSEFSCDKYDKDYEKCIIKYIEMQRQFNEIMLEYNALVWLRKTKGLGNGRVCLSNIKTNNLFVMNIEKIEKNKKYDNEIDKLKEALSADEKEISQSIVRMKNIGDYNNVFRGKNQLDFFVSFIKMLKELHKQNTFFENSHNSVLLDITKNRLSELSQYAEFPKCLRDFLEMHKIPA